MELIKFNQAYHAIMEAKTIDEIKDIRDKAEALRLYLKQQGESLEMQNSCAEIRARAERKAGQILKSIPRNRGGRNKNGKTPENVSGVLPHEPTLKELGLSYKESEKFQKILDIPEDDFENHIITKNLEKKEITSKGLLDLANKYKIEQKKQKEKATIIEIAKELPSTDHENCRYKDDLTQIWLGDAGNLDFIEDNIIDLIITSPPYNIGQKNGNGRVLWRGVEYSNSNDKMPESEYQEWQVKVLDELWRVTRSGGSLFYNHKIRNRDNQGIHPFSWISRSKWTFRQQIIWDRGSTHNKEMSYFWPHDEIIFWLTKGTEGVYLSNEGARMSTIWRFKFQTKSDHPAPFPKILPARCIRAASKEGDLILDPFGGSMTTCRAARELKRRSIGIDISEDYVTTYSNQFYQGVLL